MASIDPRIHFRDVARREAVAFDHLVNALARLAAIEKKRPLSKAEALEKARAEAIVDEVEKSQRNNSKADEVCDPLFVATRTLINEQALIDPELRSHDDGRLVFDTGQAAAEPATTAAKTSSSGGSDERCEADVTLVGLTLGLLMIEEAAPPPVKVVPQSTNRTGARAAGGKANGQTLYPDTSHPNSRTFTREFFRALGEARSYFPLAEKVLKLLAVESDPDGRGGDAPQVKAEELARVLRGLAEANVGDNEPQLRRRVNEALDRIQNVGGDDEIGDSIIDLPDLEDIQDENIVADNVRAMGPMIVSAMFDELKVFEVVDRIVEQFQQGMLPIGPGKAGRALYRYWRDAPNRMNEQERRNFASITLGIPGGNPNGLINTEFNDLWLRFVSSVSSFIRQNEVDALLRAATPSPISHQQVRKAARDLAANLSLHGFGMAHFAAREVQAQVKFMIDLLQDPEIRACFGARDMWQVVDQVATYDLGGAKTSSRYRTLATCGTIITAWLANNVNRINRATGPLIDIDQVRSPDVAINHKATLNPSDYDLVNACELWLADTATSDSRIEEMAQPREAPQMTSKPIQIPTIAREMLSDIGDIGLGLGLGGRGKSEREAAYPGNGVRVH